MSHPTTKALMGVRSELGRAIGRYGEACTLVAQGHANESFAEQRRREYKAVIEDLTEAARAEGRALPAEWPHAILVMLTEEELIGLMKALPPCQIRTKLLTAQLAAFNAHIEDTR